jgi:hypothetical protein
MFAFETSVLLFLLLYPLPLGIAAVLYRLTGVGAGWQTADRSSIGHLPPANRHPQAVVRIFAAQTVRWRGIFATHCWIVFKPAGASAYTRYDYTAWGDPIRLNGFEPDGRWFGHRPEVVFASDGPAAAALIPRMQVAIQGYALRNHGDYRAWPGPNSNTFVAAISMRCLRSTLLCRPRRLARISPMTAVGCAEPRPAPASASPSAAISA